MYSLFFLILAGAGLAGGLSACDGDDAPGVSAEPDPEPDPVADPEAGGGSFDVSVAVQLREWEVAPAIAVVKEGDIRLVADNNGNETHELVICKESCEGGEEAELAEVENVAPGIVKSFVVHLEPGAYELACLIVGTGDGAEEDHYKLGMRSGFLVE